MAYYRTAALTPEIPAERANPGAAFFGLASGPSSPVSTTMLGSAGITTFNGNSALITSPASEDNQLLFPKNASDMVRGMSQQQFEAFLAHYPHLAAGRVKELEEVRAQSAPQLNANDDDGEEEEKKELGLLDGTDEALEDSAMSGMAQGVGLGIFARLALVGKAFKKAYQKHMGKADGDEAKLRGEPWEEKGKFTRRGKLKEDPAEVRGAEAARDWGITAADDKIIRGQIEAARRWDKAADAEKVVGNSEKAIGGFRNIEKVENAGLKVEELGVALLKVVRLARTGAAVAGAVAVGTLAAVGALSAGLVIGAVAATAAVGVGTYLGVQYIERKYGHKSTVEASNLATDLSLRASKATLLNQTVDFAKDTWSFAKSLLMDPKAAMKSAAETLVDDVKTTAQVAEAGIAFLNSNKETQDAAGRLVSTALNGGVGSSAAFTQFTQAASSNPALTQSLNSLTGWGITAQNDNVPTPVASTGNRKVADDDTDDNSSVAAKRHIVAARVAFPSPEPG